MAVKLYHLRRSYRISKCLHLGSPFSSTSCAENIEVTTEIDQTPLSSSDYEAKIQFLKSALHPESLIRALDSTSDLGSSLKLFKWASLQHRFRHTAETYCRIIFKLGMAGKVDEMEGFCNELVKDRCPGSEEALLALIDSFVSSCRIDEASRVLKTLNSASYRPSIQLINVILGAIVQEKKGFQSFLFVYKEMVKASIVPTVGTLNFLLQALIEADRIDSALNQYRRMGKKGCCPNSRTFEILVSGLLDKNLIDESVVVLDEMLESGCEIEFRFYASAIPLLCRKNKHEVAMKLYKVMRASNIASDSLTYEVLIKCLSENLFMDDAINLLDEMRDLSITPPDGVFGDIINGFCTLGKFAEAKLFLDDGDVTGANSHNALLEAYFHAGKYLEAKGLFDEMVGRNIDDSISWNICIRYLSVIGRLDIAFQFLGKMIVSSFMPDSTTYAAIIIGKCKLRSLEDAMKVFHKLREECWTLDHYSYATLVECLCQREKIKEATEVFCYMSTHGCALQSSSFHILIKGLCQIGKVYKAITLLPLAYYSGTSCSSPVYNTIMLCLSELKGMCILSVVSRMVVEGCHLDVGAYGILIRSMSALGRTKDCALFLNLMINDGLIPDPQTLANLLSCLAEHSQLHMISQIIQKLISDREILNPSMFNSLINGLLKEGYRNEASHFLDVMLEKGWVPDVVTHGMLIGLGEVEGCAKSSPENVNMRDDISSILAEGFGETSESLNS